VKRKSKEAALEAAISAAGRDRVFAYVKASGWPSGTPLPLSMWWQAVAAVQNEVEETRED
jgi:hypothetical protein